LRKESLRWKVLLHLYTITKTLENPNHLKPLLLSYSTIVFTTFGPSGERREDPHMLKLCDTNAEGNENEGWGNCWFIHM